MYQNNNKSSLRVIFSAFFLLFYLVVPNVASANHTGLHSLGQAIGNAVTNFVNAVSNALSGGGGNDTNNTSDSGSSAPTTVRVGGETIEVVSSNSQYVYDNGTRVSVTSMRSSGTITVNGVQYNTYTSSAGAEFAVAVGGDGNNTDGGNYNPGTPSCTRGGPNLVVEDIMFVPTATSISRVASASSTRSGGIGNLWSSSFQNSGTSSGPRGSGSGNAIFSRSTMPTNVVNQNELELGLSYEPIVQIRNLGCDSTASPGKFINLLPFGQNGGFPNRVWVDFGNNKSIEISNVLNNVGPVAGAATIFVRFPAVIMTTPGVHGVNSTADITAPNASCAGGQGCIIEQNDPRGNTLSETFRVVRPSISLGSFLMPNDNLITGANQSAVRTIPVGAQVGLYWIGNLVNFASCTGTTTASNGAVVNDFNGQRHIGPLSAAAILQLPTSQDRVDVSIAEPGAAGVSRTYTISCRTIGGATVTDSLQIVAQAAQGCWMNNLSTQGSSCAGICGDAGGVPSVDSNGSRCMSGESRPAAGILALGSGIPNPFQWGCMGACTSQGPILTAIVNTIHCYRAGIPQDRNNSDLSVGCYCRVGATSTIASNRCTATPVVPVVPTECSDAVDNDSDRLVDALDPGCWTDPIDPDTYDETDNSERTYVTLVPTVNNLTLKTGERLTSVPFTTRNTGAMPVSRYQYTITIGTQSAPAATRVATLSRNQTDSYTGAVSYTAPATRGTVPLQVCVSHPDMTIDACDTATISIVDYQCADRIDNPDTEDTLADRADQGCRTNPYDITTYDPKDDDESNSTIVVPEPTELSITADPQVIRYDTSATLTYRINATTPLTCRFSGPGLATTTVSYTVAQIGTLVTRPVTTARLRSAQSISISCTPPPIPGVTIPTTMRTTQVEVIPQVQEV